MADSVDLSQLAEAAAVIETIEGGTPAGEQVVVTIGPTKSQAPQLNAQQVRMAFAKTINLNYINECVVHRQR
mgnify:CR=1 FL=1